MTNELIPISDAIKAIAPNARVFFYRDDSTLKKLWQLKVGAVDSLGHQLVIIDEEKGTSLQTDGMGCHLSALDWAHLYAARFGVDKGGDPRQLIHVLDLRPKAESGFLDTEHSYLPDHVRYYAPWRGGGIHALHQFASDLKIAASLTPKGLSGEAASATKRRWLTSLAIADTRAGHHEMNNSLGPLLLAVGDASLQAQLLEAENNSRKKFTKQIMLQAMAWADNASAHAEALKPVDWIAPKGCGEIRFLLLDDQADEGWVPVLAQLLGLQIVMHGRSAGPFTERARIPAPSAEPSAGGVTPTASLWVATDAQAVLELVYPSDPTINVSGGGPWKLGKHLRLTAKTNSEDVFSEVLLLDLRLFANRPVEELRFLAGVAKGYKKSCASTLNLSWQDSLAKPTFTQSADYLEALACFAQLISEVDFTYPIVIWSSTGQRKVIEALKDYANIYTGLEKPRLDAYSANSQDLHWAFQSSLGAALRRANDVVLTSWHLQMLFKQRDVFQIPENKKHIEIYIDETGSSDQSGFAVGALVVFYESTEEAQKVQDSLQNTPAFTYINFYKNKQNAASFLGGTDELEFFQVPLVFTGEKRLPKKLSFDPDGQYCWSKTQGMRRNVADVLRARIQANAQAIWITVKSSIQQENYELDGRYPTTLTECLKLIFVLFARGDDRTAAIYVATKKSSIKDAATAEQIFKNYGCVSQPDEQNQGEYLFDIMTNHSVYQPVINSHQYAQGASGSCHLLSARGVTLSYKVTPPRAAHYEWQLLYDLSPNDHGYASRTLPLIRPFTGVELPATWRHMHYFADELLEKGAAKIYSNAGVLEKSGIFAYDLQPRGAETPRTLADAGRALRWENYEEAAKLFYLEVLEPGYRRGVEFDSLEQYAAAQMRYAASDRHVARRIWASILNSVSNPGRATPSKGEAGIVAMAAPITKTGSGEPLCVPVQIELADPMGHIVEPIRDQPTVTKAVVRSAPGEAVRTETIQPALPTIQVPLEPDPPAAEMAPPDIPVTTETKPQVRVTVDKLPEARQQEDGSWCGQVNQETWPKRPSYVCIKVGSRLYFADVDTFEQAEKMRSEKMEIRIQLTKDVARQGLKAIWLDKPQFENEGLV